MSYKYSKDYDEIIDVKADMEFIENFHLLESNVDYNVLWEQMRRLYELECNERKLAIMPARGKEWWYEEEFHLNYRIQNRANKLIEIVKIKYIATKRPDDMAVLVSMLEEYERSFIDETISVLKSCLFLFKTKGTNILFGKERNVKRYEELYQELTSNQPELQKQGKQKLLAPIK